MVASVNLRRVELRRGRENEERRLSSKERDKTALLPTTTLSLIIRPRKYTDSIIIGSKLRFCHSKFNGGVLCCVVYSALEFGI